MRLQFFFKTSLITGPRLLCFSSSATFLSFRGDPSAILPQSFRGSFREILPRILPQDPSADPSAETLPRSFRNPSGSFRNPSGILPRNFFFNSENPSTDPSAKILPRRRALKKKVICHALELDPSGILPRILPESFRAILPESFRRILPGIRRAFGVCLPTDPSGKSFQRNPSADPSGTNNGFFYCF